MRIAVFDTPEELAQRLADWIVARIAISHPNPPPLAGEGREGAIALCLSGGTTPQRLYELLGTAPRGDRVPWTRTHCFWGDERFVPPDDSRSNFRMAQEALLQHVPIPAQNIHAIPTDRGSAAEAAAEYERTLKDFYGAEAFDVARPLFDLMLLGLGEDGHIASLFPNSPALTETEKWVVPVSGQGAVDRVSLTYPALASSAATVFLVAGERKREMLSRLCAGDPALPATHLRPAGEVLLFADRAAAAAAPAFSGA